MKNSNEILSQQFDSFCKKIIKREAINLQNQRKNLNKHQVSFSNLSFKEQQELESCTCSTVLANNFHVQGFKIKVADDTLAEALNHLDQSSREIILLSFLAGFNDQEIARKLDKPYWIITYRKKKALFDLRQLYRIVEI